jgi:hypothetical protein
MLNLTKPLNKIKMKESKKITKQVRNKLWGRYISIPPMLRKKWYNNSFEIFCKQIFKSE